MTLDSIWNAEQSPIEIEEFAIALYAQTLDPKIAQPDFLRFSGIIPADWGLKSAPVLQENLTQIAFDSGVTLLAQPRTVSFSESIAPKTPSTLEVPELARRYVEKLPNIPYQALSINPKIIVGFPQQPETARQFVLTKLLAPGQWREFGIGQPRANVNIIYQLDRAQLQLAIEEVRIQQPSGDVIAALLFSGSFNYAIEGETSAIVQAQLQHLLDNWATDLDTFRQLVRKQFLGSSDRIFPSNLL